MNERTKMNTSRVCMLSTGGWVLPSVLLFAGILNGSSRPQEVYLPTFPLQYMLAKNTEMKGRKHACQWLPLFLVLFGAGAGPGPEPGLGPGGAKTRASACCIADRRTVSHRCLVNLGPAPRLGPALTESRTRTRLAPALTESRTGTRLAPALTGFRTGI